MISIRSQKGQGLMEAVVAVGVLLTAIVIMIALSIATTDFGTRSESKIFATNLAREGIEIARQKRDSNWLGGDPFYKDLTPSFNGQQVAALSFHWQDLNNDNVFEFDFSNWGTLGTNTCYQSQNCTCYASNSTACNLKRGLDGTYVTQGSGDITPFKRLVFLQFNNLDGSGNPTANSDKLDIIIQVYWVENGRARTVTLESTLYDWQKFN